MMNDNNKAVIYVNLNATWSNRHLHSRDKLKRNLRYWQGNTTVTVISANQWSHVILFN